MFLGIKAEFIRLILLLGYISYYAELSNQVKTLRQYYYLGQYQLLSNIINIGFSPDQRLMIILRQNDQNIYIYNGITYQQINIIQTQPLQYPISYSFFSNTTYLIVGSKIGTLYSYKITNNQIENNYQKMRRFNEKSSINCISINQDGLIAVGGYYEQVVFYKIDSSGKFTQDKAFSIQMNTTCIKFVQKGSKLIIGGNKQPSRLFKIRISDYVISQIQELLVNQIAAAQSLYYGVISQQKIHFYDSSTDIQFFNYSLPNQNLSHISISQNGLYIVFSFQSKLIALSLNNASKEAFKSAYQFFQINAYAFALSNTGSNLLILQDRQKGYLEQYSLCKINYYYSGSDQNCVPCIPGCARCLQSSKNCLLCQSAYYFQNQSCKLCQDSMKGCIRCKQSNICDYCNDNKHFTLDPKTKLCKCEIGFFKKQQDLCVSCNITGCGTCLLQNTCQTCDTNSGFINLPIKDPIRCICQQDRYLNINNKKCQLCSKVTSGCLKCINSSFCTICNQKQHFKKQPISEHCQCSQNYLFNQNTCQLCSKFMVGCLNCKNKSQCQTCRENENFIFDESMVHCKCKQEYFLQQSSASCEQCSFLCQTCLNGKYSCQNYNIAGILVFFFLIAILLIVTIVSCILIRKKNLRRRKQKWLRQEEQYQKQENKAENVKKSLLESIETLYSTQNQKSNK